MKNQNDSMNEGTQAGGGAQTGMSDPAKKTSEKNFGHSGQGVNASNSSGNGADNVGAKAKDATDSMMTQAKATASDAYNVVAEKASSAIDTKKTELTGGLTGVADTVRKISGVMTEGDSKNGVTEYASQYVETAAKKIEGVANYFDGADLKTMARDTESFARRNPAIFLGAAFGLGVLAARFIKSSSPDDAAPNGAKLQNGNGNKNGNHKNEAAASPVTSSPEVKQHGAAANG